MMKDKSLLVLGASSEIGIKLIKDIHEEYDLIYAHYGHHNEKLELLNEQIDTPLLLIEDDFNCENAGQNVIQEIEKNGVWPTHLVHLASAKVANIRFTKVNYKEVEEYFSVSIRSAITVSKMIFKNIIREGRNGKEVCVLSSCVNGNSPKYMLPYVVSKYAMLGFVKALSSEYADKGIMINAVSPGMMETDFLVNLFDHAIEENAAKSPFGRNIYVEEVIPTIRFLLSDGADRITGQNIVVSGGL